MLESVVNNKLKRYTIEVDKYELNQLKTSVKTRIQKERENVVRCLATDNFDGADLSKDMEFRLLSLLGKLNNIVIVSED